jgi:hypothetical protein
MSQSSTTRERLIAEWRKAYAEARSAGDASGSQAAWMARLKLRLYRFLLSLYGDGRWNDSAGQEKVEEQGCVFEGGAAPLEGKPAKSLDAIRTALKSVSGSCDATPKLGPLVSGYGSEAWVVVASSGSGIDPDKCGQFLKRQGIMARVVLGDIEGTVAVRSDHEEVARRLISESREILQQLVQVPRGVAELAKAKSPFSQSRENYIAWSLLLGPVFALSLCLMIFKLWSDEWLPPTPEVFLGIAVTACALTTLLAILLHSVVWHLSKWC